ncbi:MAG: VOC family protein [Chloroflexota bacterium]
MFRDPQINAYVEDVERMVRFYVDHLGFAETFRWPAEGTPDHVEVRLGGLLLGFASYAAARRDHGLEVTPGAKGFEVVLWTDDVRGAWERLTAAGAEPVSPPHLFIGRLLGAWLKDPEGGTVHIVEEVGPGGGVMPEPD